MLDPGKGSRFIMGRVSAVDFVVVGGGFSGVEVAGELVDCLASIRRFYPRVARHELRVTVLHDQDRLLPAWLLWRAYYLSQMPTLRRKLRIYVEWTWGMFFPADITHLRFTRSEELQIEEQR